MLPIMGSSLGTRPELNLSREGDLSLARSGLDRILELDGLRGLACLVVVIYHYVFALVPNTSTGPARYVARVFSLG